MSEYATRGQVHAPSYSMGSRAGADSPSKQTPADKARDGVVALERTIGSLSADVETLHRAEAANDKRAWTDAKERVDRQLNVAQRELKRAQQHAGEAEPDTAARLAAAELNLRSSSEAVGTAQSPRGWSELSREAELRAAVGPANRSVPSAEYTARESALVAEIGRLAYGESAALAARIRAARTDDPVAEQINRFTAERRIRILSRLDVRARADRFSPAPR